MPRAQRFAGVLTGERAAEAGRIALLAAGAADDAVAAHGALFHLARRGAAAVAVVAVAVAAGFRTAAHAVAAAGVFATIRGAAVAARRIAIVAVFTQLQHAIAAGAFAFAQLQLDDATRARVRVHLRRVG